MKIINNDKDLNYLIKDLELRQKVELNDLKSHYKFTLERKKKKNILKENIYHAASNVKSEIEKPEFKSKLLKYALGIAGGFVTKRVVVGKSGGIIKNILGKTLQTLISGLIISKK